METREKTYIKDSEGRFIPTDLIETRTELKAYLAGYGSGEASGVPEKYTNSKRLSNLYLFGAAVESNGDSLYTRNGTHYHTRKLRNPRPFSGNLRDFNEPTFINEALPSQSPGREIPRWACETFEGVLD